MLTSPHVLATVIRLIFLQCQFNTFTARSHDCTKVTTRQTSTSVRLRAVMEGHLRSCHLTPFAITVRLLSAKFKLTPYIQGANGLYSVQSTAVHAPWYTRLQYLAIQAFFISTSVMNSGLMQPCNSSHTMGIRYLGYGLVLYTPIICHPVRILGNDYPGMGTVARLYKSAVHQCMRAAWW